MYDIPLEGKQFHGYGSFTDTRRLNQYLDCMKKQDCGVVSEAGTPWLSDPGKGLIQLCHEHAIPFDVLPWANALIPSRVAAGFDTSDVRFAGFIPHKKGKQSLLKSIISSEIPVFVYESVHRVQASIEEIIALGFQGKIFIGRELTKMYQQMETFDHTTILDAFASGNIPLKGEFVIGFSSSKKVQKSQKYQKE
jgi:16S rRNA (cytidine1402-2'-O)-methyltransferase